jgi:hypothetical protein
LQDMPCHHSKLSLGIVSKHTLSDAHKERLPPLKTVE